MCHDCAPRAGWSRRRFLTVAGSAVAGGVLAPVGVGVAAATPGGQLAVFPRTAWAGDGLPAGPLADEPDVRFLLVHHTVNRNDYAEDDVVGLLRNIHAFHTGPEKRWPDIAYNFIVDRFGRAWETRAGSLDRTVAGDATGGNQGFDQKCAFLGDHTTEPPTEAAVATMAALLAWLADRSSIDTAPGATASFVSRGSNRHAAGDEVTTETIAGHRAMSLTSCPGDAGFAVVRDALPARVQARRSGAAPTTTTVLSTTTAVANPSTTGVPVAPSTAPAAEVPSGTAIAAGPTDDDSPSLPLTLPGMAAAGGAAVVLGAVIARRSRRG